jgi:hypothetical protein
MAGHDTHTHSLSHLPFTCIQTQTTFATMKKGTKDECLPPISSPLLDENRAENTNKQGMKGLEWKEHEQEKRARNVFVG